MTFEQPENILYLLKNRGMRKPSDRPPAGAVPPKFGFAPCCLGRVMVGFMGLKDASSVKSIMCCFDNICLAA